MQVTDAAGWNACFGMHRADFVELLAAHLPAGSVHTGHRAVAFEERGDIARVRFANGAVAEAEVVVGADGIHSELRPYVFPPSKPVFHGTISYRGLVPRERLPDWPMDRWQMWAGPSRHFLVFPVRHGAMVNCSGSASMLPPRISSSGLTEFTSITNSGRRNQTANMISAA